MNQGSSKSLLPLVEILIAIGIFAIAVVLTLKLFLLASFLGHKTADTAKAIFEVQTVAEKIKSMNTNDKLMDYLNNELKLLDNNMTLYYNEDWEKTSNKDEAVYMMKVAVHTAPYLSGVYYYVMLDFYKTDAYPFIDEKKSEKDKDYIPLLASVSASKFIVK